MGDECTDDGCHTHHWLIFFVAWSIIKKQNMGNLKSLIARFCFCPYRLLAWVYLVACLTVLTATTIAMAADLAPASASVPVASSASSVSSRTRLVLTAEEIAYVRSAKSVRVGLTDTRPPFYLFNERGELDGMLGDYLRWISENTGLTFNVISAPTFDDVMKGAAAGEIDLQPVFAINGTPLPGFSVTRPYLSTPIVYIARRGLTDVSPTNGFSGYRVAVTQASAIDEYIERALPTAKRIQYPDALQALKAVSAGEADVFVGPLAFASYLIDKNLLFNLDLRGEMSADAGTYGMAVANNPPELASIVRKALEAMTSADEAAIRNKWAPAQSLLKPLDIQAALTPSEQEWVKRNRELRVAYDREFVPFSFESQGGVMSGLAADYLKLVERKVGLKVITAKADTWDGALGSVRAGRANLLVASARNDERRAYLAFVGPYAGVPTGIVARLDDKLIVTMDDLALERVAAIQSHFLLPTLKRQYPGIQIVEVESQRAALDAVESGNARAAIGNLNVIDPILQRHFLGVLRVANTVPQGDSELYFAVPSDALELAHILRKGLDGVTVQEHAELRQKWLNVTYQSGVPWRKILQFGLPIAVALLGILLATLWWNRKLKKEIALRTLAESRLTEALVVAQTMSEAKSRFLATMSHEIRNPVSGIMGTAHALMRHAGTSRERESLQVIRDSGDYLMRLLTQVLDYSKSEAGKFTLVPEWVDLRRLIEESINPFRYVAEQKNLQINIAIEGALRAHHQVDPMRLRQVITNLVSNAIKFTEKGGIKITLFADSVVDGKQSVRIRVQDTGPGIPEAARESLFQPYAQTELGRKRIDSTGLGLSICKETIERLGGSVRLLHNEELPNTISLNLPGACFEITLSLLVRDGLDGEKGQAKAAVAASDLTAVQTVNKTTYGQDVMAPLAGESLPNQPLVNNAQPSIRVLLADDDALNLALHREVLEGAGYIVDTAANGHVAFTQWLREGHEIIFSDGSMPVMSGLEFVKAVRAAGISPSAISSKATKPWVVLLTSYSSALDRDDFIRAGVDDFIEKPLLPRGLQEAMVRRDDALKSKASSQAAG
jgi:two-component system, NarL family, sensor histidine kinase EvgS